MSTQEHLEPMRKERLRGQGERQTTRVPWPLPVNHILDRWAQRPRRHRWCASLSLSDEAVSRCPCTKPQFGIQNAFFVVVVFSFLYNHIQTRKWDPETTQTGFFRGGERVRAPLLYSCSLNKTVWKRKCCLWFKAQANRMGDRALCLLSAVQLECKAVGMKGVCKESFHGAAWILMFIWKMAGLHSFKWINHMHPFHSAETLIKISILDKALPVRGFLLQWSHHSPGCHVAVAFPALSCVPSEGFFLFQLVCFTSSLSGAYLHLMINVIINSQIMSRLASWDWNGWWNILVGGDNQAMVGFPMLFPMHFGICEVH